MVQNLPVQNCTAMDEVLTGIPQGKGSALMLPDSLSDIICPTEIIDYFYPVNEIRMNHEIRTSMNAIMGFAQILKCGEISSEDRNTYSEIICKETENLLLAFNQLLKMMKMTPIVATR
jgi:hypothetical protein